MKKLFTLLALAITLIATAQAPPGFNYQATVRNSSGALVINQNVLFKFNIMLNSQTSLPVYSETHQAPTDDLGQVNLTIGSGTPTTGSFSNINWGNGSYFLGIELNTGTSYVAMGTTQLLSVPFALYANSAGSTAVSLEYPDGITYDSVFINSSASFQVPSGKNLLINNSTEGIIIDNVNFNIYYPPIMIAGPGQTISMSNSSGFISGFLTNAGVTAISIDLTTGDYIVPAGKSFVLFAKDNFFSDVLLINNNNLNATGSTSFPERPLMLVEGTLLSCQCSINGYLK
jgi:hypothetical protein